MGNNVGHCYMKLVQGYNITVANDNQKRQCMILPDTHPAATNSLKLQFPKCFSLFYFQFR